MVRVQMNRKYSTTGIILLIALTTFIAVGQTPTTGLKTREEKLAAANKAFDEGMTLFDRQTLESYRAARTKLIEAARLYREAGEKSGEATTLNNLASVHNSLGEYDKALEALNLSLPLLRLVGNKSGEAAAVNNMGAIYNILGEKKKALEYYNQALQLIRLAGDKRGEAMALLHIATVYNYLGENQKALEHLKQSLQLSRTVGDKSQEASTLSHLGLVYNDLRDRQKALDYLNQALPLRRAIGDKLGEARTLHDLGMVYKELGENQKALEYYNQSLTFLRVIGYKPGEASTLNGIGMVYQNSGEGKKALEYFKQSLALYRLLGDKSGEAVTLNNFGLVYGSLGEEQKALEYFSQTLPLRRAVGDKKGESASLNNIGMVYQNLGDNKKALEYLNQSLSLSRAIGDKSGEARILSSIGVAYSELGDKQKSLEHHNQSLQLLRLVQDKRGEATSLSNIGTVYSELGEKKKALEYLNQSLTLSRAGGDKWQEAITLHNMGRIFFDLGERQKALEYFNQSLPLRRAIGDKPGEALTFTGLMVAWVGLNNRRSAIIYGKQAVNKFQELRQTIQGLDKETQKAYLGKIERYYQMLADILIGEGRFAEAQQVLALLKEEEYFEYVRRDAGEIKKLKGRADLKPEEQKLIERYNLLADRITALGSEFQKLDEKKRRISEGESLSPQEQKQYDQLSAQLTDANAAFRLFLEKELVAELGKPAKKEIEIDRSLQAKLRQWGEGTVMLYTLVGEDRYRVILTTPTVQVDGKTEIKAADLNRKVFAFREALQNPAIDPRPLGKELYDALIKPIEKHLEGAQAKTLVWSLDGTLRYIPLAALSPDGKTYLVEKYQNVVVTSATRQSLTAETQTDWRALGLGASLAQTVSNPVSPGEKISFAALPGVKTELATIIRDEQTPNEKGILVGKRLLDTNFNARNFADNLTKQTTDGKRKYTVVHLASHFRLGGDSANSFLLLGDGKTLTLEQISDSPEMTFEDVDLVTLSACNTAFGDNATGKEVDSLATFIELRGAKSVMATLWSVADDSTSLLMSKFYEIRRGEGRLTKAEALRRAQVEMIAGKHDAKSQPATEKRDVNVLKIGDKTKLPPFEADKNAPFAHPYFWSPFVLIGNWR